MTLAWPWSVPRLPFSRAVRPNSDMVRQHDIVHAVAEIVIKRRQTLAKFFETVGQLAGGAAFVDVGVPAVDFGEGDLHTDVGFDQSGDLL